MMKNCISNMVNNESRTVRVFLVQTKPNAKIYTTEKAKNIYTLEIEV